MTIPKKFNKAKIVLIFVVLVIVLGVIILLPQKEVSQAIKIGYFHGGRTMLLYRAYINNEFEKEGVGVNLLTKDLHKDQYYTVPKSYDEIKNNNFFGKARGGELIDQVIKGETDGATPGESSFIEAASKGLPIVVVAMLGHDTKEAPGHAIIFRKDVIIKNSQDIKGKTLSSRRAGEGDRVFLEEFLEDEGIDSKKDVKIVSQVNDDEWTKGITLGNFDGGYYHLMAVEGLVKTGQAYVYRKFDWVNPELSNALLVFRKDIVKKHPKEVEKIVRAYMKRIRYEHSLPKEERLKDPGEGFLYGLQVEKDFQGMNLPQYDFPPRVRVELLDEMQELLLKHQVIDKKVDLSDFIDNRFVEEVYQKLK